MKYNLLNRKVHYWAAAIVALPILVIISSGLFLQMKKEVSWIQPETTRGVGKTPELSFPKILEISRKISEAKIKDWNDIDRLDVRPSRGMVKVRSKNYWEIQIDLKTGEVLQIAYRRSDIIESIHDGSFLHEYFKFWLFLPAGIVLLLLWMTGIYMFFLPYWVRRRRRISNR